MKYLSENVLHASDAASQIGMQIDSNQLIAASFHLYCGDSTLVGTLQIQGSNDISPQTISGNTFTVTNWVNIPGAGANITSGGSVIVTINPMCYRWLQAVLTVNTPGSTTAIVNMFAQSA